MKQKIKTIGKRCSLNIKENWLTYVGIFITGIIFFCIIWPIMFTAHDDIVSYMNVKSNWTKDSIIGAAIAQGRISFLISTLFAYFPFIFDNYVIYKLIFYVCISFSVFCLGKLIYSHINKKMAFLTVLLFLAFAQVDNQHNLLVSYAVSHTLPIGFVLLSIDNLLIFYKKRQNKFLIYSALLLLASSILYESFMLFSILIFIIVIIKNKENNELEIKNIIKDIRFHVLIIGVYLIIYLCWRIKFPTNYDGVMVGNNTLSQIINVIMIYSTGMFPLNSSLRLYFNGEIQLSMLEILFIFKALTVTALSIYLIKSSGKINKKYFKYGSIIAIIGMILPVLLHSLTPKYAMWVEQGSYGYVPTWYSYFFVIILISMLFMWLYQHIKSKKIFFILIGIVVFFTSILTDMNNKYYADEYQEIFKKYIVFDKTVKSEVVREIEDGATIFIPDYEGIHHQMYFMTNYAQIYQPNKAFTFTNKLEELHFNGPTYVFKYDDSSNSMLIGRINDNLRTDEITIIGIESFEDKSIILHKTGEGKININGEDIGNFGATAVYPLEVAEDIVRINGENIDTMTTQVVNEKLPLNVLYEIKYGDGFYNEEIWGEDIAYWCNGNGQIIIENNSPNPKEISFSAKIATGSGSLDDLVISGEDFEKIVKIDGNQQEIDIVLPVNPGINKFRLSSDATPLEKTSGDDRELVFYLLNPKLK